MDIEQVLDYLVEHRSPDLAPEALAEVFMPLVWCLDDEANVMPVVRRWLTRDDEYRVAVTLWMDDIFPTNSRDELVALAADVGERFPALAERAADWVRRWDRAYGTGKPASRRRWRRAS